MKVILLQDVKGTGKKGQVLEVSDGHAKNFLIPKKFALEASKSNLNDLESKKQKEVTKKNRELQLAQDLAKQLEEKPIKIPVKMGENGKLFGSVTNKEIAQAMETQLGASIDKKKIVLSEPIKTVGEKTVDVKLHVQVTAKVKVDICSI